MEPGGDFLLVVGVWIAILAVVGLLVYFFIRGQQPDAKTRSAWQEAQTVLGLKLHSPRFGYPWLEGTINNRQVKARSSPPHTGRSRGSYRTTPPRTTYTAYHNNRKMPILRLEADKDTFFRRVQLNEDQEFDPKNHISFAKESIVQSVFTDPLLRQKIMELTEPFIFVGKEFVRLSEPKLEHDPEVMRQRLALVVALAEAVEKFLR